MTLDFFFNFFLVLWKKLIHRNMIIFISNELENIPLAIFDEYFCFLFFEGTKYPYTINN
jgi:hypothetical protein